MSDGPCWETKYYIADLESFPFMSPIRVCTSVFKFTWSQTPGRSGLYWWGFLQTGKIRTRQQWMEDANKKCGNILLRYLFHRERVQTRSSRACLLGGWNSEPCLNRTPRRSTTGWVCLQDIWTLCQTQYVINRTRQFTVRDLSCDLYRAASSVDSITDYNEFSPRRSREVDGVHLTFLFKATFLFNYFFIYFSVLQAECSLTEVLK